MEPGADEVVRDSTHYDKEHHALVTNRESQQNIADLKGLFIPKGGKKMNITINRQHHTKHTRPTQLNHRHDDSVTLAGSSSTADYKG